MNRIFGLVIVLAWAVALSLLLSRDVIPHWRAQDPPSGRMPAGDYQIGIFDAEGRRIGTSWVSLHDQQDVSLLQSTTKLTELAQLRSIVTLPVMLIDSSFVLTRGANELQGFTIDLRQAGNSVAEVSGTRIGQDYACSARVATIRREFSLDARATAGLSESLRPFDYLSNLKVGQTWQIRMLDFVSLLREREATFVPQLVQVTGRETIKAGGKSVECFRIETNDAVAWADDHGRVLLQRVQLPLLGTIELRDEPFDAAGRQAARRENSARPSETHRTLREAPAPPAETGSGRQDHAPI